MINVHRSNSLNEIILLFLVKEKGRWTSGTEHSRLDLCRYIVSTLLFQSRLPFLRFNQTEMITGDFYIISKEYFWSIVPRSFSNRICYLVGIAVQSRTRRIVKLSKLGRGEVAKGPLGGKHDFGENQICRVRHQMVRLQHHQNVIWK
jgi:hypothetical protein